MKSRLLLCILSLAFFACQESPKTTNHKNCITLDVNIDAATSKEQLSHLATNTLIVLPTSDSLLLSAINRINSTEKYIYIADPTALYRFSWDGVYKGGIKRQGSGPEEYPNIGDFQIDNTGNAWISNRGNQSITQYSWDNQFKERLKIELWMERFFWGGNGFYVYTGNDMGFDNIYQLHYLNPETRQIEHQFKQVDEHKAKYLYVHMPNVFQKTKNGEILLTQLFNDTVYSLTPTSYIPKYVINLEGKNIPESFYERDYQNIMEFFTELHKQDRYAYGIDIFLETEKAYWIGYFYQRQYHLSILPKNDSERQLNFNTLYVDKLFGYPINLSEATLFVQNDGRIIIPLQPDEIMEYAQAHLSEEQQKQIKDYIYIADQNPILLVINPL